MQKLVIVHQGALGDFLLALPVFEGIHIALPRCRMDFWAREGHSALISSRPYFGRGYSPDSGALTPFYHESLWRDANPPASFIESDRVLVFGQASARLLVERLSQRLSRPALWLQSFPDPVNPIHVTEFLRRQLPDTLLSIQATNHGIERPEEETSAARNWIVARWGEGAPKPVMIHPGSGGTGKIWPVERWWALLKWMREVPRLPVILSLGPADEKLRGFGSESTRLGAHVLENVSLPRLAGFLSESRLFVGSDSGVSHLAAAVGIPAVIVFGPSDDRIWAPIGPHVCVVKDHWKEDEVFLRIPNAAMSPTGQRVQTVLEQLIRGHTG